MRERFSVQRFHPSRIASKTRSVGAFLAGRNHAHYSSRRGGRRHVRNVARHHRPSCDQSEQRCDDHYATASSLARLLSICLQASSSSFTASTLTLKLSRAVESSSISTIRSTPFSPITTGTPT